MHSSAPPALGGWLLGVLCHPRFRDIVEGDIVELFQLRQVHRGRAHASYRYLLDVLSLFGTRYARTARTGPDEPEPRTTLLLEAVMIVIHDLRHAARSLLRTPAFSAVVVLTLALAIGANSAIFSVVDGVLLKPLPFDESASIVVVQQSMGGAAGRGPGGPSGMSQDLFLAWRETGSAFDQIAMYSNQASTITSFDEPVRLNGAAVAPALFPLLRVDAMRGRTLAADEEIPGKDAVVVLSYTAWQRYFGGDDGVVGAQVDLDEKPRTVVGVMPPGFNFPDASVQYWVPMRATPPEGLLEDASAAAERQGQSVRRRETRSAGGPGAPGGQGDGPGGPGGGGQPEAHMELWANVVARLADGVSPAMAAEEGSTLLRGLKEGETDAAEGAVQVQSMQEQMIGSVRSSLTMLMGAVGFVLLIACANVANLVMARSVERRKETAVRAALGAGWWNLARLLFIESLLLALAGAAIGLGMAYGGLQLLASAGPDFIPRLESVSIDARALLFTAGVTFLTAVLFSLVPARSARALDLTRALKQEFGGKGLARGLGRGALRKLLVTVEVAASVVLLVGAGLLISSFIELTSVDPGYDVENLLHVQLQLPASAYPDAAAHLDYYDGLVTELESLPGVLSTTVTSQPPNMPANIRIAISRRNSDEPPAPDEQPEAVGIRVVENGYFDTLRARAATGRLINRDDRPEMRPVAVISESGARAMFGDSDPIGEELDFFGGQPLEIVGVAEDIRNDGVDPTPQPDLFLPYRQAPSRMVPMLFRTAHVMIRTGPAPLSVLPDVRTRLRQIDPGVVLLSVETMRDRLSESVAEPRFYAMLVAAFASLALVLAAVGIYGMLAYTVQQGVRDTAIRRALGAPTPQILRAVVSQGMALAGIGLVIGIGAATLLGRVLESMLYAIEPTDPTSLAGVAVVFLAVSLFAVWMPARHAVRIDPMDVLREG